MWTIAKEGRSEAHTTLSVSNLDPSAKYLFTNTGGEDRSHAPVWAEALKTLPDQCIEVTVQEERKVEVKLSNASHILPLADPEPFASMLDGRPLYIDVSGLAHHVWAPLLKIALKYSPFVRAVYFEPENYRAHSTPSSTSQFDLSEGFRGVEPIPGFANLIGPPSDSKPLFIPFLGFEGPRARQVAMTLDPIPPTIPIVGLPGFRLEYPQISIASNQEFIIENLAWKGIRFANASCPFEAYSVLVEIRRDNPGSYLYVAPLGTKPHALGAICFAIDNPSDTEIMYDHPMRSAGRTVGVGAAHIYHLKSE